ncbi:YIP1 family protein [Aestuariibacter salexigens]|uniref:YIP1 family protein n=1 Tax=Aestuariibacter salexigens TaxID=226010 RepID=UPI00042777A9|nr:YIP1 family protein [Aestuariibacter salexigens]
MHHVSNPFQACNDIFIKPNGVFAAIAEKHNWSWLPFFMVIVASSLPVYMYFNFVDFAWYTDLIISSTYGDLSPAEQDSIRQNMSRETVLTFALIGNFLGYIVINALVATYLNLVTKSDEENLNGFTDWYGFTWWVAMPVVIGALVSLAVILLSGDHQLQPASISPTSLAFWFGTDMGSDWFALSQSIRLEAFWSMYLMAVGVSQWTRFETQRAYIIAIAPYALIWTVWALFAAF